MQDTKWILAAVSKKLDVSGGCKWLSLGPELCPCAMCQVERMKIEDVEKLAQELKIKFE